VPQADSGQRLRCLPVLLGGLFKLATDRSPAWAFAAMADQRADDRLEMERLIRKHPLDAYRFNPHFPVNRLKIMRGAFGSTNYFVDGGIHFGKDRLREVEDATVAAAVATKARMPQTPR
jgi:2-hydroxychromene-2-carboxylate isomerase